MFLAVPDDESRKAAFARAVRKARAHAELLADAAGTNIGTLLHLSGRLHQTADYDSQDAYMYEVMYEMSPVSSNDEWLSAFV